MDRDVGIKLGARLRELRQTASLSQSELAFALRKTKETISNIERGKTIPSVLTLTEFSEALGVSVAEFFRDGKVQPDPLAMKMAGLREADQELARDFVDLLVERRRRRSKP